MLCAGGCAAGLVWHGKAVPSPGWCQCPGRNLKLQRLLPAQGPNPPPAASSTGPSTAEKPSLQQNCARAHKPAMRGLSMRSHARALPRVPLSPWGGMDVKEDAFGTEKVLINAGVMFWAVLVLK